MKILRLHGIPSRRDVCAYTFLYSVHGRVSDRVCTGHGGIIIAPLDQRKMGSMVSPMTVEDSTQQKS